MVAIEELHYKLNPALQKIIKTIKSPDYEHSAYINIKYKRPLQVNKGLKTKISEVLYEHLPYLDEAKKYRIHDNLEIQIFPAERKLNTVYHIGAVLDYDKTCFVVSETYNNLKIVITEKEEKIIPYKEKYQSWWLALVDTIGYGMTDYDINQFKELPAIETYFGKILLIPPYEPEKGIVLFY